MPKPYQCYCYFVVIRNGEIINKIFFFKTLCSSIHLAFHVNKTHPAEWPTYMGKNASRTRQTVIAHKTTWTSILCAFDHQRSISKWPLNIVTKKETCIILLHLQSFTKLWSTLFRPRCLWWGPRRGKLLTWIWSEKACSRVLDQGNKSFKQF